MDHQLVRRSKKLSWLLRHGAHEAGITMDAAGWVPVAQVLAATGLSRAALADIVAHNNKRRLELVGDRVRACQGHSTEGTPVTAEALEATWAPFAGPGPVWHGTHLDALDPIDALGLVPQARTHVHLAEALDATVGKRANVAVMLAVDPAALAAAGCPLWVAPNGVLLARRVPRGCIVGARPMTRAAQARAAAIQARFGAA